MAKDYLFDSKKVVPREIRSETGTQIGELKHQWPEQIDITFLDMNGIPQLNKERNGLTG